MIPTRNDATLQNDNRAVAPVVGFILIFAILVLAFVQYQAQVVPQQNAETEFEHFEEHQNEMVELRSAILTAGTSDRDQYPTVQLGTTYQTRTLALNGPPPAGTLQTRGPYPINISDESGNKTTVETRFLEYQPGYFEIDVGSTWYENSVLYLEEGSTDAERVFIEDQKLINKGTLQITALKKDFQRTGTDRITLELRTLENETAGNLSYDKSDKLTVEMPTRLERNYWHNQLNDSGAVINVGESTGDKFDPGVNRQNLTVDNVTVNSIGIRDVPDEESAKNVDPLSGTDSDDEEDDGGKETDLPEGYVAFDDQNGNGEYDATENEEAYKADQIGSKDFEGVNLVIVRDVLVEEIDAEPLSVNVQEGVIIKTTDGPLEINTDSNSAGTLDASGATLVSSNSERILLKHTKGNANINLEAATVQVGKDGSLEVNINKKEGDIILNDTQIKSNKQVDIKGKDEKKNNLYVNTDTGNGGTVIENFDGENQTLKLQTINRIGELEKGDLG